MDLKININEKNINMFEHSNEKHAYIRFFFTISVKG